MLIKGITKLSELAIDADKDWNVKGISNIKQVAVNMAKGDLLQRGDNILQRIQAGPDGYVLTAQGPGKLCVWAPAGGALRYYFPATIGMSVSQAVTTPDQSKNLNAPLTSGWVGKYDSDPAHYIYRMTPAIASARTATAVAAADQSHNTNTPLARGLDLQQVVDGAVADDGGVLTNETAAAQSAAANDMHLLPAAPAVGDAYMLGSRYKAHRFPLNIGTAGAGNWTLVMYYWNGAWTATVGEIETTNQFMAAGQKYWQHTPQADWALSVISGLNLYWVRIEVTNFVNLVTQPLGTQAWWMYML